MNVAPPKFCPSCGLALDGDRAVVECESMDARIVFDCYCSSCEWSGDISPDEKLGKVA